MSRVYQAILEGQENGHGSDEPHPLEMLEMVAVHNLNAAVRDLASVGYNEVTLVEFVRAQLARCEADQDVRVAATVKGVAPF